MHLFGASLCKASTKQCILHQMQCFLLSVHESLLSMFKNQETKLDEGDSLEPDSKGNSAGPLNSHDLLPQSDTVSFAQALHKLLHQFTLVHRIEQLEILCFQDL